MANLAVSDGLRDDAPEEMRVAIEREIHRVLARVTASAPPKIAAAVRHAVIPGGGRLRPRLLMAVAASCGTLAPDDAYAAAVSLELIHAASLVHDDLPCFDDADMRRGRPSTHRAFGEPLAVLAGDALIVLAFESLAVGATPRRVPALTSALARAAGLPSGLVAGQALESEASASVVEYHRAKTASLFSAAAQMGALVAGEDPAAWAKVGELIGRAYQAIDDIRDAVSCADEIGKPVGRDRALGRPSLVQTSGVVSARAWTRDLLDAARAAVPTCERPELVRRFIDELAGALTG